MTRNLIHEEVTKVVRKWVWLTILVLVCSMLIFAVSLVNYLSISANTDRIRKQSIRNAKYNCEAINESNRTLAAVVAYAYKDPIFLPRQPGQTPQEYADQIAMFQKRIADFRAFVVTATASKNCDRVIASAGLR